MKNFRQISAFFVVLACVCGLFSLPFFRSASATPSVSTGNVLYLVLKKPTGFVLARASRDALNQPTSQPQVLAAFADNLGQLSSDRVLSVQPSPDGRFVAITTARDHGEQCFIYDVQAIRLQDRPAHMLGRFLHWLPGSDQFLFYPMMPAGPEAPVDRTHFVRTLWRVDAASGDHTALSFPGLNSYLIDASPSPDGSRLIYSTTLGLGQGSDIWLATIRNGAAKHLAHLDTLSTGSAQSVAGLFSWSPDGSSIAYERLTDSPVPFLSAPIWLMDSQGSQTRQLAIADGGHGYGLSWSPDSRRLAFISRANSTDSQANLHAQALESAISVVDVRSGAVSRIADPQTTGLPLNIRPMWSQDGASLSFVALTPVNGVVGATARFWVARPGSTLRSRSHEVRPLPEIKGLVALG